MRFSLPQQAKHSLPQLLEQLEHHIATQHAVEQDLLKKTIDTCFSSGFCLVEIENALQCEVDKLEQVEKTGVEQLIQLIQQRQL